MIKMFAVAAIATIALSPVSAAGPIQGSMDELSITTKLAEQVEMFKFCGLQAALSPIPAQLAVFEASHYSRGVPITKDMTLAGKVNTMMLAAKAPSKQAFCNALAGYKAKAVPVIHQSWANLQAAHAKAKSAGH